MIHGIREAFRFYFVGIGFIYNNIKSQLGGIIMWKIKMEHNIHIMKRFGGVA